MKEFFYVQEKFSYPFVLHNCRRSDELADGTGCLF